MIWFGRLISLPLSILFFTLLLVTLIFIQISNSFLDPDFYLDEIREVDIYEFAMGELLTTFIDEARANHSSNYPDNIYKDLFVTTGLTTEQLTISILRVVPPKLVQLLTEQSFREIGNYITGERENFNIQIKSSEQSEALVIEIKSLIPKLGIYNFIFEKVITPRVNDAVDSDLPLGITLSSSRVIESIQTIFPPNWAYQQTESSIDAVTPYLLGETDDFQIRINLEKRSEIASDELKRLFKESYTQKFLYNEIIAPNLISSISDDVDLPYNLTITNEEIIYSLRQAVSVEWAQIQIERIINDATPYLLGETESFSTVISLADSKRKAEPVITNLVDTHLAKATNNLPLCRIGEAAQVKVALEHGMLPHCLPPDISIDSFLSEFGIKISESTTNVILSSIPNRIRFTDTQLIPSLNTNNTDGHNVHIDKIRKIFKNGWIYTDENLREDIFKEFGQEGIENLEYVRLFLRNGIAYSTQDLQSFKPLLGRKPPENSMRMLNEVRTWIKLSHSYKWAIWVFMALILVTIGILGGRDLSGRIIYGSVFLAIASGIILVVFGPLYDNVVRQHLENQFMGILSEFSVGADLPLTTSLLVDKLFEVSISIADKFTNGIFVNARNIFVMSLLLLGTGMLWESITGIIGRTRTLSQRK